MRPLTAIIGLVVKASALKLAKKYRKNKERLIQVLSSPFVSVSSFVFFFLIDDQTLLFLYRFYISTGSVPPSHISLFHFSNSLNGEKSAGKSPRDVCKLDSRNAKPSVLNITAQVNIN